MDRRLPVMGRSLLTTISLRSAELQSAIVIPSDRTPEFIASALSGTGLRSPRPNNANRALNTGSNRGDDKDRGRRSSLARSSLARSSSPAHSNLTQELRLQP